MFLFDAYYPIKYKKDEMKIKTLDLIASFKRLCNVAIRKKSFEILAFSVSSNSKFFSNVKNPNVNTCFQKVLRCLRSIT